MENVEKIERGFSCDESGKVLDEYGNEYRNKDGNVEYVKKVRYNWQKQIKSFLESGEDKRKIDGSFAYTSIGNAIKALGVSDKVKVKQVNRETYLVRTGVMLVKQIPEVLVKVNETECEGYGKTD